MANTNASAQRESVSELLGQLGHHCVEVIHDEIELVIKDIREKVAAVCSGVLAVLTGAITLCGALLSLLRCLDHLAQFLHGPGFAALFTLTALALIGVVFSVTGYRQLKK